MLSSARLRSVAALLAGAYVVHTLRYMLAFGSGAGGEMLAQGHGYLAAAPPVLTVLLAAAVGGLVLRLAPGAEGAGGGSRGGAGGGSGLGCVRDGVAGDVRGAGVGGGLARYGSSARLGGGVRAWR